MSTVDQKQHDKSTFGWARCAKIPSSLFANPVILNDNEIIISPYGKNEYLRCYNILSDKWHPYIPYPTELTIKFHTIAVDCIHSKIHLYDGINKIYIEFDTNKQLVTKCKKKRDHIMGAGKYPSSIVIYDKFHVIGGSEKQHHLIWDNMTNKFIPYNMLSTVAGHGTILLNESLLNQQIIVLGGNDNIILKKYCDSIYIGDIKPEISWKKLLTHKMPHKMYYFGNIKTNDNSRIIIFGGKCKFKKKNNLSDEIWILSLKTWKWHKSHCKTPKKAKFYAVLTANDYVHLFEYEGTGHWKLHISSIITQQSSSRFNGDLNINTKSLTNKINDLSEQLMNVNEENRKLKDIQKEHKHKLKKIKDKNKDLIQQNQDLKNKIKKLEIAKDRNKNRNGHPAQQPVPKPHVQQPVPQAQPQVIAAAVVPVPVHVTNIDLNNYKQWNANDIVKWICTLYNGRFSKYSQILIKQLNRRNVNGSNMQKLTINHLKSLGVTEQNDAITLLKEIQILNKPKSPPNLLDFDNLFN